MVISGIFDITVMLPYLEVGYMAKKTDAQIVGSYRGLIDFMVKTKSFRGYSTMDYIKERVRDFDPDYFAEEDALVKRIENERKEKA